MLSDLLSVAFFWHVCSIQNRSWPCDRPGLPSVPPTSAAAPAHRCRWEIPAGQPFPRSPIGFLKMLLHSLNWTWNTKNASSYLGKSSSGPLFEVPSTNYLTSTMSLFDQVGMIWLVVFTYTYIYIYIHVYINITYPNKIYTYYIHLSIIYTSIIYIYIIYGIYNINNTITSLWYPPWFKHSSSSSGSAASARSSRTSAVSAASLALPPPWRSMAKQRNGGVVSCFFTGNIHGISESLWNIHRIWKTYMDISEYLWNIYRIIWQIVEKHWKSIELHGKSWKMILVFWVEYL